MNYNKKQRYLQIAKLLATKAGGIHRKYFGKPFTVESKSTGIDLVTEADLKADSAIRRYLYKHCPDDILMTEETFEEGQAIDLSHTWVVDPLDGTTNFAHHMPHFAVSIAYFENGEPQVGVVYDPIKKELFSAIEGGGAFLNDTPILPSMCDDIAKSLLVSGFPYDSATNPSNNLETFVRIKKLCHGVRSFGAAALDLCYVACGRFDGYWEIRLSPWDVAAGALIASEAGVKVSDLAPEDAKAPAKFAQRSVDILATATSNLHEQVHAAVFEKISVKA